MSSQGRTAWRLVLIFLFASACSKGSEGQKARRPARQAAVVSSVTGEAYFKSGGGASWHPASAGFSLVSGDALSTTPRSRAEVQTRAPNALLRIGEGASFVLEQTDSSGSRSALARLTKGGVWGSIKALGDDESFSIAGPALAEALGSATFRMEVGEDGTTKISVYEGEVRVKCPSAQPGNFEIHTLARNEGLQVRPGQNPESTRVPPGDPWRRGWEAVSQEDDLEPIPPGTRRIEEKPRPRPAIPQAIPRESGEKK